MIKIIDLLEDNQVEACAACRMVWLDPNEGEKIKKDQELILNSGKKIILSENGALEQQFYWEMGNFKRVRMYKDHGETYLDKYQRLSSRRPGLDWLIWVIWRYVKIDTTKAQVFAKSHPFITLILFLLLIIVSIKILAFLFAGGHLNFYRTSPRRYFFF